ncbi:MAG: hypothetical protein V3T77_08400, partial [Planctomycetota bacterium]
EVKWRVKNLLKKGDRAGLMIAAGIPQVLLREAHVMTEEKGKELLQQLESIEIGYESLDIPITLQELASWVQEKQQREGKNTVWDAHFYTDLQRKDWLTDDGSVNPAILEAIERLGRQHTRLIIHPLGKSSPRNATVVSLRSADRLLSIDLPTSFQVSVANFGKTSLPGLEVELWVNGQVQGSRRISVDGGDSIDVSFPYVFRDIGPARIQALLRSDDLPEDNARHVIVQVRESVEVLLVDGGYDSLDGASEADWLRAALGSEGAEFTGVRYSPYRIRIVTAERLQNTSLDDIEILVLANVGRFSQIETDQIEEFLQRGGGVLAFIGHRVDPGSYNLYAYRDGQGWFPYSLMSRPFYDPDRDQYYEWQVEQPEHPALEFLARTPDAGLAEVKVFGYWRPSSPVSPSSVLMALKDGRQTPALVESTFQYGSVLVLNSGADRTWSNFPISPAYVCFLYEVLPHLVARRDVRRNLQINEPFTRVLLAEEFARRVLLLPPDGGAVPLALEERPDHRSFLLKVPGQSRPGAYEVRFGGKSTDEESRSEWFAVNVDPREGQLERISGEELREFYPEIILKEQTEKDGGDSSHRGGEVWRNIFWVVLVLLGMESLLALHFGRGQRVRR